MKPVDVWLHRQIIRLLRGILSAWEEWVKRTVEDMPSEESK